jgi:cytochrome c556
MRRSLVLLAASLVCAGAGCERRRSEPATKTTSPAAAAPKLDGRRSLPLLPAMAEEQRQNMRGHLEAIQQVVAGLAAGDFAAVEAASKRIGSSPQMHAMCARLAAGSSEFQSQAMNFHRTADSIGEAARGRDSTRTLAALSRTLVTCTACHATFRQEVVDESTWQALIASRGQGVVHPDQKR